MKGRVKIYELAKELAVDPQNLVAVVQRLGIDVKNSMNLLGSEEVRTVREYYKKNKVYSKPTPAAKAAAAGGAASKPVSERRVGTTVIRRRTAATPAPEESKIPEKAVEPEVTEAPQAEAPVEVQETLAAPVEAAPEAVETAPTPAPQEPVAQEAAQPAAPTEEKAAAPAPAPEPAKPKRRVYTSIIKKVGTEQYLGEKIGPKQTMVPKPKIERKPAAPGTAAATATGTAATAGTASTFGRRGVVKEVELAPEVAKDANKKRTGEGQNVSFKRADYLKREMVHATKKKKSTMNRPLLKTQITVAAAHKRVVEMGEKISVADFAKQAQVKAGQVISKLMNLGVMATVNESIDFDTATLVAQEFQYEVKQQVFREEEYIPKVETTGENLKPRSPVVTIMGHVDHGKTSLLDKIRQTAVAAGEAGGITQHIGAYMVETPKGKIAFLDTPGHEAFTAMRARGAKVTDLVVLVVSATDGVQPQTLESVNHAKAAKVPIIVAVNKTDLPDANPDRIKQTLSGHELAPEEWGGDTIYVNVSAKTGKGIDSLLESILLQAELLELKANFDAPMSGAVIESKLDKNRGALATILVQHGKLSSGDIVVAGTTFGKVRAMTNSMGKRLDEALPSEPVEILGLPAVPNVGDDIFVVEDERKARELTQSRIDKQKAQSAENKPKMSLDDFLAAGSGTDKELRVIVKADVQGSSEALKEALMKLPQEKCKIKILHSATGGITESDVMLAHASKAVILGFNVRPDIKAQRLAEQDKIEIRTYNIIYDLLEDTKKLLLGLLDKVVKEKVIGRAEVRNVFTIPKVGTIAGSAIIDGKVTRGCHLRLLRENRVIYEGKLSSLRRFKEDVKEVQSGYECGIGIENFSDLKLGDQFEAFIKEEVTGVLT